MSDTQFEAFKQALQGNRAISFKDGTHEYIFSGAGSSAVLLKMEDVQGRIGTPNAVIKKGTASEAGVKPPVAISIIGKAPVIDVQSRDITPQKTALIKPSILALKGTATDCDEELLDENWQIARLNSEQSLLTLPC